MTPKWYSLTAEEAVCRLNSNAAVGLSHKAARLRYGKRKLSGESDFYVVPRATLRTHVSTYASDMLLWTLLLTLGVLSFFEATRLAIAGIFFLVLNFIVSSVAAKEASVISESILRAFRPGVKVLREGKLLSIDSRFVIPGDVVLLSKGDMVPFDARILTSGALRVSVCCGMDSDGEIRFVESVKDGAVTLNDRRELPPEEQTNMVTAGSTVLSGTARVLVVETGGYTYIGALLGGFPISNRTKRKTGFVRNVCCRLRYIGVFFLILTLPLTGISVLLDGVGSLAISFLTVLSLSVTFFPGWIVAVLDLIALRILRKTASDRDALIRNPDAAEALSEADVLLLFGKSMLTDGLPHVAAIFAEGALHTGSALRAPACRRLAERGAFFALHVSELPSSETTDLDRDALLRKELLAYAAFVGVDREMLRIRFQKEDYHAPTLTHRTAALRYTDVSDGEERVLFCSSDPSFYLSCTHLKTAEGVVRMSPTRQYELSERIRGDLTRGSDVYIYAERERTGNVILLGYIAYAEQFFSQTREAITTLSADEIRPLLVLRGETAADHRFAVASGCVSSEKELALASEFRKADHMIYDGFGRYGAYLGFKEEELSVLIRHLSEGGHTVCGVALDGEDAPLLALTDVSAVCGDVRAIARRSEAEELTELPIVGAGYGREAPGEMRLDADVVVRRLSRKGGGLPALSRAITHCKRITRNRKTFLSYLTLSFSLRAGMLIPSIVGLDSLSAALSFLFAGVIFDLFAGLVISYDDRAAPPKVQDASHPHERRRDTTVRIVAAFVVGVLLSVLPFLFPFLDAGISASVFVSFRSAALLLAASSYLIRIRFKTSGVRFSRPLLWVLLPFWAILVVGIAVRSLGVFLGIPAFLGFSLIFLPFAVFLPWLHPIGN